MNESSEFITRCPSCSTSFRVTSEQIDTADGAVRCGACLRIFQADQQLVIETSPDLPGESREADPQPCPPESGNDDSITSALEDEASEASFPEVSLPENSVPAYTTLEHTVSGQAMREGPEREIQTNRPGWFEQTVPEEKLPEDFVSDDDDEDDPGEEMLQAKPFPKGFGVNRHGDNEQDEFVPERKDDEKTADKKSEIENEEHLIEAPLGDVRENHQPISSDLPVEEVVFDRLATKELEEKYWQDWEDYLLPNATLNDSSPHVFIEQQGPSSISNENQRDQNDISDIREYEDEDDEAAGSLTKEEADFIPDLELGHDPDELVGEVKQEEQLNPLWIVATIILLISGSFQYIWFNKDLYAQNIDYRSYYVTMCDWLGCELPEYMNAQELVAKNLLIRSHSQIESALIVDAILQNSGQYRQKFPDLRLWFRNIENVPIAARRFSPAEYLAGELRGLRYIPANTEVRFSIEITDPGENALGYSLEVLPQG